MKRLYLMRHAKSDWHGPSTDDHDRPLSDRGRRAGAAVAAYMQDSDVRPELVLCSSARRTRETLALLKPAVGDAAERFEEELYGASAEELFERLLDIPDEFGSVLVIGHNPGMQQLVADLARPAPEVEELVTKFPTGALATLESAADAWIDLRPRTLDLIRVVRPRELE
jgi:phosphohistidine phosphatase